MGGCPEAISEVLKDELEPPRKNSQKDSLSSVEVSQKLISAANKIAFHLNKAAIRMKRNWKGDGFGEDDEYEYPRKPSVRLSRNLCVQLSSIDFRGKCDAQPLQPLVSSRVRASSTLLSLHSTHFVKIASFLDANSVLRLAQVCSPVRRALLTAAPSLKKRVVTSYEVVVAFNNETETVDVRALKRNRSIRDEIFCGHKLDDVIPQLLYCMAKVTFGNGVNVSEWKQPLVQLHADRRLTPLSLVFTGGALSKGNICSGADLRTFSESEFVNFVGRFYPHVQEVQLLTTRLFKTSSSSARLLSFISMISCFGVSYERPAVKYFFEDVKQVASFWRHDPLSRSCTVYMRTPSGSGMLKWMDLGGTVAGNCNSSHRVTIPHTFQSGVSLVFHLH